MVTDDRGNVERWLGFVFYVFKEYDPESVEIRTFPGGRPTTPRVGMRCSRCGK